MSEMKRAIRSLMMYPLRTFLSTLGIVFGIIAVITMLSIGEGAKQETLEQIQQMGLQNLIIRQPSLSETQNKQAKEQRSSGLTLEDAEKINAGLPFIQASAPIKTIEAVIENLQGISPETMAVTRSFQNVKELELAEGRFISDQDCKNKHLICVLGYDVARKLGSKGHIGNLIYLNRKSYQIVGILKPSQWQSTKNVLTTTQDLNKAILIPLSDTLGLTTSLSEIIVKADNSQSIEGIAEVAKNILKRSHHSHEDYQIIIPQAILDQANRTQLTFNLIISSIAAISLIVGGIGIMNIMLANVSERTREIGIRRAVGADRKHIMQQFVIESMLLTFIGAIFGIALGSLFALGINLLVGWKIIITAWSLFISILMALGVGLVSGIYPAAKAANMHPIVALRSD